MPARTLRDLCAPIGESSLKAFEENNCKSSIDNLSAIVISHDELRFESTSKVLERIGFTSIKRYHPLQFQDPELNKKFSTFIGENISSIIHNDGKNSKYRSLTLAFLDIMKSFAQTKGSMSDWLYIFEDDIALHNLSIAPICDIKAAETVAMGDGILYLGACPKTCYKFSAVTFLGRVFEKCWGHCAHAIGITKWKSFSLPELMKTITYNNPKCWYVDRSDDRRQYHPRCYYFDIALRDYGKEVSGGIYLAGSHMITENPGGAVMRGMIYQDRNKFKSSI